MIAAKKFFASPFHGVVAADEREVVRDFITAGHGEIRNEDAGVKNIDETWNLQTYLSRRVGDDVEGGGVKLKAQLILRGRSEHVILSSNYVVVVGVTGSSCGEAW